MTTKQTRDLMTSIIYEELFGKSRIEMLTESRPRWDGEMVALWQGDLDEVMRDHMTSEALEILGDTEETCAIRMMAGGQLTVSEMTVLVRKVAKQVRLGYGEFKLWEWE